VYLIVTLSHPIASVVYSAKSLRTCIWPNMAVSASIPTHKHGQKWPLRRLKVKGKLHFPNQVFIAHGPANVCEKWSLSRR
jgi:hypothetical protein